MKNATWWLGGTTFLIDGASLMHARAVDFDRLRVEVHGELSGADD